MWKLRRRALSILAVAVIVSGCGHTLGQATLTDGNVLLVQGQGSDVSTQVQCLTPDTITKLTGSNISPGAPKQDCYTVVSISAKSSNISNAITQYVQQSTQLQAQGSLIASAVAGKAAPAAAAVSAATAAAPAPAASPATAGVVSAIVSAAVSNPANPTGAAQAAASNAAPRLAPNAKSSAQQQLQNLSTTASDPSIAGALRAAAGQLQ